MPPWSTSWNGSLQRPGHRMSLCSSHGWSIEATGSSYGYSSSSKKYSGNRYRTLFGERAEVERLTRNILPRGSDNMGWSNKTLVPHHLCTLINSFCFFQSSLPFPCFTLGIRVGLVGRGPQAPWATAHLSRGLRWKKTAVAYPPVSPKRDHLFPLHISPYVLSLISVVHFISAI